MVTVYKKDCSHLDEIMILDLHAPYTIVHQKDNKATLDIHIKIVLNIFNIYILYIYIYIYIYIY